MEPVRKTPERLAAGASGNHRGVVSVLMSRFGAIGEVAMTIPVVYSACRCYPDVSFVMVTRPALAPLFVNPPENLKVVGADIKHEYRGFFGARRLARELKDEFHPDAYLDLQDGGFTAMLGAMLRLRGVKKYTLGRDPGQGRALTRRRNKVMLPLTSLRARYREVFFKAGLGLGEKFKGLYPPEGAPASDYACICQPKAPGQKWLGIAPFAAYRGKTYPAELTEKILEKLMVEGPADLRVFLFGADGSEAGILERWAGRWPGRVRSLAGKKFGFPAELALLNRLDALLAMDSANMHFASLTCTPTVSIWGATHPYCGFKAWRQNDENTVQLPLSCRPCSTDGHKPCHRGDYLCMAAIRPDTVYKQILKFL